MLNLGEVFRDELDAVEKRLYEVVRSDLPELNDMVEHILSAGGKRIRPLVMLLTYRLLEGGLSPEAIDLAVAFELIHTATLVHDDINDGADRRRGVETLNRRYGDPQAIVVGDYLFVKGFEIGGQFDAGIVKVMAHACARIAAGEILQLQNMANTDVDPDDYYRVIRWKTAEPIAACARVGAMLAGVDEDLQDAFHHFGLNLGMAFQMVDDLLDYVGDDRTGKPIGIDLKEGKITLPVIHALESLSGTDRETFIAKIRDLNNNGAFPSVVDTLQEKGSFDYTRAQAREHLQNAKVRLEPLPASDYKKQVMELADFVIARVS